MTRTGNKVEIAFSAGEKRSQLAADSRSQLTQAKNHWRGCR